MTEQKTPTTYRQGDFLIIKVNYDIPDNATKEKRDHGKAIIGYGEVTGHHHAIAAADADIYNDGEMRWIVATDDVEITHQEHATIQLPAGTYTIRPQREYHAGMIKRVID